MLKTVAMVAFSGSSCSVRAASGKHAIEQSRRQQAFQRSTDPGRQSHDIVRPRARRQKRVPQNRIDGVRLRASAAISSRRRACARVAPGRPRGAPNSRGRCCARTRPGHSARSSSRPGPARSARHGCRSPASSMRSVSISPSTACLDADIGAAPQRRRQAEDRRAMDDAAVALRAHDRHDAAGEVMPAEEIGLELLAQAPRPAGPRRRPAGHGRRCCRARRAVPPVRSSTAATSASIDAGSR